VIANTFVGGRLAVPAQSHALRRTRTTDEGVSLPSPSPAVTRAHHVTRHAPPSPHHRHHQRRAQTTRQRRAHHRHHVSTAGDRSGRQRAPGATTGRRATAATCQVRTIVWRVITIRDARCLTASVIRDRDITVALALILVAAPFLSRFLRYRGHGQQNGTSFAANLICSKER
jgi:hypothetical protein